MMAMMMTSRRAARPLPLSPTPGDPGTVSQWAPITVTSLRTSFEYQILIKKVNDQSGNLTDLKVTVGEPD